MRVRTKKTEFSLTNSCFQNCESMVAKYGGTVVSGWLIADDEVPGLIGSETPARCGVTKAAAALFTKAQLHDAAEEALLQFRMHAAPGQTIYAKSNGAKLFVRVSEHSSTAMTREEFEDEMRGVDPADFVGTV